MFLGYNTNGFAHHRLTDAVDLLAEMGYRGIGLTIDVHHLDCYGEAYECELAAFSAQIERHQLRTAIETGSRFLLNPKVKHQPTLLSANAEERAVRFEFLSRCIDVAKRLRSDCVSFWSGTPTDDAGPKVWMSRLVEGCVRLADEALAKGVRLAFEPEPGMFIDTMAKFAELHAAVNHPAFGLTLDVGHLVCMGEIPVRTHVLQWKHVLWNVHIDDMRRGVHDHLMFGEGEVNFAEWFAALREANYRNGVYVELSRHSYDAVNAAQKSRAFLETVTNR